MDGMGQHSTDAVAEAAGKPLRRAYFAAWAVFLGMAGTSMTFQVYHAVTKGHMPWPLAALYGIVPLGVSIGVLEVAAAWQSKTAKGAAWLVTGGAMYLSAFATGAVSASAAPSHAQLLFGAVLDGAALIAARFILDGPRASQAVAIVAQRETTLITAANAERFAREEAEAALRREVSELRAQAETALKAADDARRTEVAALGKQLAEQTEATEARLREAARVHQATVSVLEERMARAIATERGARETAQQDTARAQQSAAHARARADSLARKLDAAREEEKRARAAGSAHADGGSAQDDATNELRALMEFRLDPTLLGERQGGKLADKLGVHPATGRRLHKKMVVDGKLRPEYEAMAAPLTGGTPDRA